MDGLRFDQLSKQLAAAGSRRKALQALTALSLGSAALALDETSAKPGRKRRGVGAEHFRKKKANYCLNGETVRRYRRKQEKLLAMGATLGKCETCLAGQGQCNGGCCNNGVCAPGTATNACGASGAACAVCGAGESCVGGKCVSGTCAPDGSCAPGCCDGVSCQPGDSVTACGLTGDACSVCAEGEECISGTCVDPDICGPLTCPNGCCEGNSCQDGDSVFNCGTGGVTCETCDDGQNCESGVCCLPSGSPCLLQVPC